MGHILGIPKSYCQGIPNFNNVRLAYMKTWNERLKAARAEFGCTQTELAREVGVSNATVSDWESGEIKKLEGENLLKICEFLHISPTWLQFGRGERSYSELTADDLRALEINRMLGSKEKRAWYRAGNSLAEPDEGTNGKQ
ncbi:MAG: helix-turn-helix domain-containing protein [Gallionellaceae bacterium]|jgi:transcriptional regulator with XRE-family HTH domain